MANATGAIGGGYNGTHDIVHDSTLDHDLIEVLTLVAGSLSFIGCAFTIFSYGYFPATRSPTRLLMAYLAVADGLQALFFMVPIASGCDQIAIFGIFAANCSFFWTVCVALHIALVSGEVQERIRERCFYGYHVFGWGAPFLIAMFTDIFLDPTMFGNDGLPWCYMKGTKETSAWRFGTIYGPMWISWLLSFALCAISMAHLHRLNRQQRASKSGTARLEGPMSTVRSGATNPVSPAASLAVQAQLLYIKFMMIPLSFLILRTPGTCLRLFEFIKDEDSDDAAGAGWRIAMAIGEPSQGWVNALIFVASSPGLQRSLYQMFDCSQKLKEDSKEKLSEDLVIDNAPANSPLILGTAERSFLDDGWSIYENSQHPRHSCVSFASEATDSDYTFDQPSSSQGWSGHVP